MITIFPENFQGWRIKLDPDLKKKTNNNNIRGKLTLEGLKCKVIDFSNKGKLIFYVAFCLTSIGASVLKIMVKYVKG